MVTAEELFSSRDQYTTGCGTTGFIMHTSEQTRTPTILGRACSTHISSRGYKSLANIRNPWKTPLTCRILKKIQLLCFRKGKIITKGNKIRLMLSDTFALIRCSAFGLCIAISYEALQCALQSETWMLTFRLSGKTNHQSPRWRFKYIYTSTRLSSVKT